MPLSHYIVFSDLDGTLLDDRTYCYDEALPALRLLQEHEIPLVFCSAKTRAEQMVYRDALQVHDPFIVENGGAVMVERGYFKQPHGFTRTEGGLDVLQLAIPRIEIRRILAKVRSDLNLPLQGYGDMEVEDVARLTGLDTESAARAMRREFEETVVTPLDEPERERLARALARHGVSITSGARFISLSSSNDKGRAARALTDMFRRERDHVVTVGIGDSWNDAALLAVVDIPLLVQRPGGTWASLPLDRVRKVKGVGPKGWSRAMQKLVREAGARKSF